MPRRSTDFYARKLRAQGKEWRALGKSVRGMGRSYRYFKRAGCCGGHLIALVLLAVIRIRSPEPLVGHP